MNVVESEDVDHDEASNMSRLASVAVTANLDRVGKGMGETLLCPSIPASALGPPPIVVKGLLVVARLVAAAPFLV